MTRSDIVRNEVNPLGAVYSIISLSGQAGAVTRSSGTIPYIIEWLRLKKETQGQIALHLICYLGSHHRQSVEENRYLSQMLSTHRKC